MNRIILSTLLSAAFSLNAIAALDKPAPSSEKPTLGSEKPALGSEKPALGSEKPALGSEKPALGSEKPALGSEKPALGSEKPTTPEAKKPETDHAPAKMTKADRTQKHLADVKKTFEDHKTKVAAATGTAKKMGDYYMARAKLAIEAAEDGDMKDHMMIHIREAKFDLKKADRQMTNNANKKEATKK